MRSAGIRVAVAGKSLAAQLVGEDDENIGAFGHGLFSAEQGDELEMVADKALKVGTD